MPYLISGVDLTSNFYIWRLTWSRVVTVPQILIFFLIYWPQTLPESESESKKQIRKQWNNKKK